MSETVLSPERGDWVTVTATEFAGRQGLVVGVKDKEICWLRLDGEQVNRWFYYHEIRTEA